MKYEKTIEEWEAKSKFLTYFDGIGWEDPPVVENLNTFVMGVTDLSYDSSTNTLHVELRRPGLLIGKGGSTVDAFQKWSGYKVNISEKLLQNHRPKK